MSRTRLHWAVGALGALLLAGCTGGSGDHHEPPPPQSFGPVPGRAVTGNADYMGDLATDGKTAIIVGGVDTGMVQPTFRRSVDAGASWQEGRLDPASAAAVEGSGGEHAENVTRVAGHWLALGYSADRMLSWESDDGSVWRREQLDPKVFDRHTDDVEDLRAVGDTVVAVGSRTPAGGSAQPIAWRRAGSGPWAAVRMGGAGDLAAVAARGSVLVAVGSTEDDYVVERSADTGRTWQRVSGVPRIRGDGGFSRFFADVAATDQGFVVVGSAYTKRWVPVVYESADGRSLRAVPLPTHAAVSAQAAVVAAARANAFVGVADVESGDRLSGWSRSGGRWVQVSTPSTATGSSDVAWSWEAAVALGRGWGLIAQRQTGATVNSQIWRSAGPTAGFSEVRAPWSGDTRPQISPFDVAASGDQFVVVGTSQALPALWRGTGPTFGDAEPLSTNEADSAKGVATSGQQVLVFGGHQSGANDGFAVVRIRAGAGPWFRTKPAEFQTSSSPYASSSIAAAARIGRRWYVVRDRSDDGSLNRSALVFSSTDGRNWTAGRAATTMDRKTKSGYDVTDLSGSDDVSRSMSGIAGTSGGLLAVGSTGKGAVTTAATWRSADGGTWSLKPLTAPGFDRSVAKAVAVRGPTAVIGGLGWRPHSTDGVPISWVSSDAGRTWRFAVVAADQALDSDLIQLAVTNSRFVLVGITAAAPARPVVWQSASGADWQPQALPDAAPGPGETVVLRGVVGVGADLVGLLDRTSLSGDGTVLFRQRVG